LLITFEGIDGCGKSTQIELLKNYLNKKGISKKKKIRSLLLHETKEMDSVTELLLFSAARSQLINEKILPLLKKNQLVILDRFFDSTTAYQGYGRESADLASIQTLNRLATHNTKPDLTFYLKIQPDSAARRTSKNKKDRMEISGYGFFKKVVEGYDLLAKQEKRFHTIDAELSPEEIHSEIVAIIENYQESQF